MNYNQYHNFTSSFATIGYALCGGTYKLKLYIAKNPKVLLVLWSLSFLFFVALINTLWPQVSAAACMHGSVTSHGMDFLCPIFIFVEVRLNFVPFSTSSLCHTFGVSYIWTLHYHLCVAIRTYGTLS
jgi:hypothetical protein